MKSGLQKKFGIFHENIKLNELRHNKVLREKRDMLLKELRQWLKKNGKPTFDIFNQGSYAMGTGIESIKKRDYDIDVGLIFNIKTHNYPDPTVVKAWVEEALSQQSNRSVEMKTSCVRVQYHRNERELYHIDLAIYGRRLWGGLELAKGKKGSQSKKWERSEPKKLKQLLDEKFRDQDEREQFKRVIRYLKRWKDHNFSAKGNATPPGIAFTTMAYHWFRPSVSKYGTKEENDFEALKNLVNSIVSNSYGLGITLPVQPYNSLLEKMSNSYNHVTKYKGKLKKLQQALNEVARESELTKAIEILRKQFGDDFPK